VFLNLSRFRDSLGLTLVLATAFALAAASGCSKAGGANSASSVSHLTEPEGDLEQTSKSMGSQEPVARLERLRSAGRFDEFVAAALIASDEHPQDAMLQLFRSEALLAAARNEEAEQAALRAAVLAIKQPEFAAQAIRHWTTARLRQGGSLDSPTLLAVLAKVPPDEPAGSMLRFWQETLNGRLTYRFSESNLPAASLPLAEAATDSLPNELAAVQARANGVTLPVVFIDTGGQHTLMTPAAARDAGVQIGLSSTQLTGFVGLSAQAGLIETLELGNLVLHDVPVLVGDSPPLTAAQGQMSLGTDLMHHVRFTIDYPARQVTPVPAAQPRITASEPAWSIPVWTFPQVCLGRGELPDGAAARVLVDTGNQVGTFVSYRWARRNLPQLAGPSASMVFRYKKRNLTLEMLDLGSGRLTDWPVVDTIPTELDRLHLVDVMLGCDLLAPYRLTIDLPARVLELRAASDVPAAFGHPGAKHDLP
jgi:hypothetical protein